MLGGALRPLAIPGELWQRAEMRAALGQRDIARVFQLVYKHARASQMRIGAATGLSQSTVSQIMSGARLVTALEVIERIADGLAMPDPARLLLGLAPRTALAPRTGAGARRSRRGPAG